MMVIPLGPASALYADRGELRGATRKDGVVHLTMPHRIDMVFTAGTAIVGGESKKPQDLVDSSTRRRLHRQMDTLIKQVDVPTLMLRGSLPHFNGLENKDVMFQLVCLQRLGVILLPLPIHTPYALDFLSRFRDALVPLNESRTALSAIRGTDARKVDAGVHQPSLLRAIKGVGPELEVKLITEFGSPLEVMMASEDELRGAGASKTVANRIKELVT